MSKIDEFINGYSNHPMNALLAYDRAERLNKPTDGLMVVTVDDLEQLRPYVELAEMIMGDNFLKDIMLFRAWRGDNSRFDKLYKQIKEQSNGI